MKKQKKQNNILINIILLLCVSLITLTALEIAVRIYNGVLFDTTHLSSRQHSKEADSTERAPRAEHDAYLGWVPNSGTIREGSAVYTVNEEGIRTNGEESLKLTKGTRPILAVGDSFTFGEEVNDNETWPAHLERLIGEPVINGGVFNYGLDQIVLRAEELAKKYNPRLLILSFIPDDVARCELSLREYAKPFFSLSAGKLTLKNVPVPLPGDKAQREMDLFRRVFGYSHLADLVMRRINIGYWLDHRVELAPGAGERKGAGTSSGTRIGCALTGRLAALSEKTDIVILAQYEKNLYAGLRQVWTVGVLECARENGLKVLDLYEPLRTVRRDAPDRFATLYTAHMTGEGNRVVAKILKRYLSENGLVK